MSFVISSTRANIRAGHYPNPLVGLALGAVASCLRLRLVAKTTSSSRCRFASARSPIPFVLGSLLRPLSSFPSSVPACGEARLRRVGLGQHAPSSLSPRSTLPKTDFVPRKCLQRLRRQAFLVRGGLHFPLGSRVPASNLRLLQDFHPREGQPQGARVVSSFTRHPAENALVGGASV